jgi:hypothetical protein
MVQTTYSHRPSRTQRSLPANPAVQVRVSDKAAIQHLRHLEEQLHGYMSRGAAGDENHVRELRAKIERLRQP